MESDLIPILPILLFAVAAVGLAVGLLLLGLLFGPPAIGLLDGSLTPTGQEDAARRFLALDERIWWPLALFLSVWTVHSMRVSHRVAGPLVQFRRQFGEIRDGHWTVRVK